MPDDVKHQIRPPVSLSATATPLVWTRVLGQGGTRQRE